MNAKFLNEAKDLEARWAKTGLLDGMDKKFDRRSTAVLLECQRLHNETGTWGCCDECKEIEKEKGLKAIEDNLEKEQLPISVFP